MVTLKVESPWEVESIYDLQYYNCPCCTYKNHSKQTFVDHAFDVHPESIIFIKKISDGSLSDILCPWDSSEYKTKFFDYNNYKNEDLNLDLIEFPDELSHEETDEENNFAVENDETLLQEDGEEYSNNCLDLKTDTTSQNTNSNDDDDFYIKNKDLMEYPDENGITIIENDCLLQEEKYSTSINFTAEIQAESLLENPENKTNSTIVNDPLDVVSEKKKKSNSNILKNHKCDTCGKFFSRSDILKTHIKTIHEGQSNYKCDSCGRSFNRIDNLRSHIKNIHDGI